MYDTYKSIHSNPIGGNRHFRYDVVYLGNSLSSTSSTFPYNDNAQNLHDDYVFIFSTYLNPKDEEKHGSTSIKIEKEYKLSHFSDVIQQQTYFHSIPKNFNLVEINEFVNIEKSISEDEVTINATLLDQPCFNSENEIIGKIDRCFLLIRENFQYDNMPITSLSSEFEKQITFDFQEGIILALSEAQNAISRLNNAATDVEKDAIKIVWNLLNNKKNNFEKSNEDINSFLIHNTYNRFR